MSEFEERRSYFRIEDVIGLDYHALEPEQEFPRGDSEDTPELFRALLDEIDVAFNRAVNTVWQRDPAIAQALGLLNRKLDLIAEQCPQDEVPQLAYIREQRASISGSGLSFTSPEPYAEGSRLGLSLVLKPSHIQLRFAATVVACEPLQEIPSELFLLRVKIDESNQAEQEQLVQHVVQKQYSNLNSESAGDEPEGAQK